MKWLSRTRSTFFHATVWLFTAASLSHAEAEEQIRGSYRTAAEIKAMPIRTGLVDRRAPCYVVLITANGTKFSVGSPGNTPEFAQFIATLKEGVLYEFPQVYLDFEQRRRSHRQ
jgi:hypothetical protein